MKCMIEFLKIPEDDLKHLIHPVDDSEYNRVLEDMIIALNDGDYTIEELP